jgi:uncharacterized protein (TIGR02145 family)
MKTKITLIIFAIMIILSSAGQTDSIEFSFTSNYYGDYVFLDSVCIHNLSQGGDTIIYGTVLTLYYVLSGTEDIDIPDAKFTLNQNYPNPFRDVTTINICLAREDMLHLKVYNLTGHEVVSFKKVLKKGHHTFSFYPGAEKFYILKATVNGVSKSLKMIGIKSWGRNKCTLVYCGMNEVYTRYKSINYNTGFPYCLGDSLRFIGYADTPEGIVGSDVIIDTPLVSQVYTFEIIEGIPCPDTPAIFYEEMMYTTVLVGSQCWLKENLNIGTMINGMEDMEDNDTIEKYCFNNISYHCEVYGGFYQWNEMMQYTTQQGVQGICPEGWHIPTDDEYTVLTDYLGGVDIAGGKMRETGNHHWIPNVGATNSSGFTALGAGLRIYDGSFGGFNHYTGFWSSTEKAQNHAWGRFLDSNEISVTIAGVNKVVGYSVRCIRDEEVNH